MRLRSDALGEQWTRARFCQRRGQFGENRQVGMEPHPLDPSHAQREQRPLILEPPELALDGATTSVERLPALRLSGHEGMQAIRLDPARAGLALTGRATPLGRATRRIGPGEGPRPVLAARRVRLPGLDAGVCLSGMIGREPRASQAPWIASVSYPMSSAVVSGANPRSFAASRSAVAKDDSCARAVSTCQATGRSVRAQTAAWTL